MTEQPILLRVLLTARHWQTYSTFCTEYDKAARQIDRSLMGSWPSRAQLHRWMSGALKGLPYSDHCRVLETMFGGEYTARELFEVCAPEQQRAIASSTREEGNGAKGTATATELLIGSPGISPLAGISAAFATRGEFYSKFPPHTLFDEVRVIRAAGLSLNILCQQYPDRSVRRLIEDGGTLECLFLDPDGEGMAHREREEGFHAGYLADLTRLNMRVMLRLRDQLPDSARDRLRLAVYDETIRFNILLLDQDAAVVQPYLPQARGVDSPTLMVEETPHHDGLLGVFTHVYAAIQERSRPV